MPMPELAVHRDGSVPSLARIEPYDWVLVLGCGTGWTSRRAARRAHRGQVLGLDGRPWPLERARELARDSGLDNVRYAGLEVLDGGLGAGDFDAAMVHCGVHLPGPDLAAVARVLAPGGRVVVETAEGDEGRVAVLLAEAGFGATATAAPGLVTGVAGDGIA